MKPYQDEDEGDEVDKMLSVREQSAWQREATNYCRQKVAPGMRNKFEKFYNDDTLARIRTDQKLCHTACSSGYCKKNLRSCKRYQRV